MKQPDLIWFNEQIKPGFSTEGYRISDEDLKKLHEEIYGPVRQFIRHPVDYISINRDKEIKSKSFE